MTNHTDQQGLPDSEQPINPFAASEAEERDVARQDSLQLNPWLAMMSDPRSTTRYLLDNDPTRYVLVLAILGAIGLHIMMMLPVFRGQRASTFIFAILHGGFIGVASLYLMGWIYGLVGRSLGGVGRALQCRTALAWSQVPTIWFLPVVTIVAVYCATQGADLMVLVEGDGVETQTHYELPKWLRGMMGLGVVVELWQVAILSQAMGEAHQMSSLRGFVAVFISGVLGTAVFIAYQLALLLPLFLLP